MGSIKPKTVDCDDSGRPVLPWSETPLIESAALSRAAGCRIFCKLDNLQPGGSFKSRGIGNFILKALQDHTGPDKPHFYCCSGGNAGIAAVVAARSLGCNATVVVPTSTSAMMIEKLHIAGAADVVQHGESWVEANTFLNEELVAKDPSGIYVPAFDHPRIWEGNASLITELKRQLLDDEPDVIVCSVGGGGLFAGLVEGVDEHFHGTTKFLAIETKGADSLNNSLRAGENVTLPAITSIATSLGAKRVANEAFERGKRSHVVSAVLTDADAALGCCRFADDERILVEPACGVSIAACYNGALKKHFPELDQNSRVVVVVCGGSAITPALLEQYRSTYNI